MDKVTLNDEQLCRVIDFIESRGFHDPGVIVEILDHFACKVEERMSANSGLSLEDAMSEAHYQFGSLGFYPLLANYEANTKKKYGTIYRAEWKKLLTNPLYLVSALIASFLMFKAYGWAETNAYIWNTNMVGDLLYIAFNATYLYMAVKFKTYRKQNKIYQAILSIDLLAIILIVSLSAQFGFHKPNGLFFLQAFCAVATFFIIARTIAQYQTLKAGKNEVDKVQNYLEQKHSAVVL